MAVILHFGVQNLYTFSITALLACSMLYVSPFSSTKSVAIFPSVPSSPLKVFCVSAAKEAQGRNARHNAVSRSFFIMCPFMSVRCLNRIRNFVFYGLPARMICGIVSPSSSFFIGIFRRHLLSFEQYLAIILSRSSAVSGISVVYA